MGELVFVGLGLYDESGVSLRGLEETRGCDYAFVELYTSVMPGLDLQRLSQTIGKTVQLLSRREVEEEADEKILSKAKVGRVAFLVPGDPMVATTHVDLRLRAQRAGIRIRIIHAATVASAAAAVSGLQSYKFGRTITIPVSYNGDIPASVYTGLETNHHAGLHSLVLLEVDVENDRHVTIPQALKQLLTLSARTSERLLKPQTLVVGLARLGSPDMFVRAGTVSEVETLDFGDPPYCLIFPTRLHFVEAEALEAFCGASKAVVSDRN
jgi:diphthine synthase